MCVCVCVDGQFFRCGCDAFKQKSKVGGEKKDKSTFFSLMSEID